MLLLYIFLVPKSEYNSVVFQAVCGLLHTYSRSINLPPLKERSDRVWHCQQNDGLNVLKMASTKWQENVVIIGLGWDHLYRAIYDLDMPQHAGAQKQLIIMPKIALTS